MWTIRRTAVSIITGAALVTAGTAAAAPDWTAPQPVGPKEWIVPSIGFASDGTEFVAHIDWVSQAQSDTKLVVSRRKAGGSFTDELTIDDPAGQPGSVDLAVAPNGAAVVAWQELVNLAGYPNTSRRYRAAYRSPDGTWGQPVMLAAPFPYVMDNSVVVAAIAPDGTGAAGAVVEETSGWGETQPDQNVLVAVHPAAGSWSSPEQLSPYNVSADGLQLAFDDNSQLTGAWEERYTEGATASSNDDGWRVVTRRRAPSNGIWSAADDLTGSSGSVWAPELGVGPDGRAVIAWHWDHVDTTRDAWAATRASAAGSWSSPHRIVSDLDDAGPLAAAVAPDGAVYVQYFAQTSGSAESSVGAVRMPAGGAWGTPKPLQKNASWRSGRIAFVGSDPVLVSYALHQATNQFLLEASRWSAGASEPDAPRSLEQPDAAQALGQVVSDRRGSVVVLWSAPSLRIAVLDGGVPDLASSNVPTSAVAGEAFDASVNFADMWSSLAAAPTWDFGDGSAQASGDTVTHTYAQPGTYTIRVSAADTLVNATTKTFTVQVGSATSAPASSPGTAPTAVGDAVKPVVTIALPRCRPHETKRACVRRRGTRVAWRMINGKVRDASPSSGIAKVQVAVTLLRNGRATGPVRFRTATVKGTGWSRKAGRLKRGRYVIRVRAFDAAGNVSSVVTRKVTLR